MSTPPFLDLPLCARARRITTERGELATLVAECAPAPGSTEVAMGTAVLVPGFTGSKEDFIGVLEPLATRGWRVVALDQRGQFESTPDPDSGPAGGDDPGRYDVEELAADLAALISALGTGPVHLLGHSFGGLVARAATIASPGLLRSLTLLGSGPGPVPAASQARLALLMQALASLDLATIWEAMQALDAQAGVVPPPEPVLEFLRGRFLANSPTGLARLAHQLLTCPDRTDELAAATARGGLPVLVAHGADDDVWTPHELAAVARRLGAAYEVVDGAGHSPAADRPLATAAVLDRFWRGA
ncbi:MAG TPA: alpha/beta hydrolase [Actinomycetes bacterium]|nr:alpha/beta hydrolase [Actinomycetes bacterium]